MNGLVRVGCSECANSGDGPGRQRKWCWQFHPDGSCCAINCGEREECDGTEPCSECGGTGMVTIDLAEARRYLRGAA